ncbi:asparaginase domain-containing protein [Sphingopyxis sp. XHP0097]|uniref:Asparaginase domain-containing protein n=1 Tax=Sphingopyxis jiangsuensis TaxID=2871171 RepID=A0ABS7MBW1_9SPHN|nr:MULTISPECIES: asparaginase domain-containing protein [Sphingopyxis]MBL0768008.1 asparaginase [Sphingopyxis lutea]MBY4636261.1 asparaginase domain-containing protein [Sphingopyxis jiangsuensis]
MIEIFTTGGTIDKVYFDALSEYQVGPTTLPDLLRENNVHVPHRVTQLMRKDSLELDDADREAIRAAVAASDATQVLVTHGTDTMAVTGRVLQSVAGKTIVMTGAMQPASVRASDAEFNVGFALAAVQTLPPGVYIAMNGMIFDPARTVKDRAGARFVAES